jgi:hypothetical protein
VGLIAGAVWVGVAEVVDVVRVVSFDVLVEEVDTRLLLDEEADVDVFEVVVGTDVELLPVDELEVDDFAVLEEDVFALLTLETM